jgi:hypothetical protein
MREAIIVALTLGLGCSSLLGCSAFAVQRYAVSTANVTALRTRRGQWINVGPFGAVVDASSVDCGMIGPIRTADGESFSQYVRAAFLSELQMAEVYSETAPITIGGTLDRIDFSMSGEWGFGLTLSSSNGKTLHVEETYQFAPGWSGEGACSLAAQVFMPGVQDLIAKVLRNPAFPALVSVPVPTAAPALVPLAPRAPNAPRPG